MTRPWRLEGSTLGLRAGSPKSLELSVARYLPGPGLSLCLPGGVTLSELCLFSRLGEQADQGQHTGWGSMGQSAVWLLTFLVTLSLGYRSQFQAPKVKEGRVTGPQQHHTSEQAEGPIMVTLGLEEAPLRSFPKLPHSQPPIPSSRFCCWAAGYPVSGTGQLGVHQHPSCFPFPAGAGVCGLLGEGSKKDKTGNSNNRGQRFPPAPPGGDSVAVSPMAASGLAERMRTPTFIV